MSEREEPIYCFAVSEVGERPGDGFRSVEMEIRPHDDLALQHYRSVWNKFADLRSLGADVLELTRLTIEPFDFGSFVVPARLEAVPISDSGPNRSRLVSTQDVVRRFAHILAGFVEPRESAPASIDAIQAIESLGRLIRREVQAIEFSAFDALDQPLRSVKVDAAYVRRVSETRLSRQPTHARQETLEGKITALDLRQGTLWLSLDEQPRRVKGTFSMLFQPSLLRCLDRRVRLRGQVERKGRQVASIQVIDVEVPDDEG